ncbi:exported hypothetical protein [metagenome]|uniref:Uncharacterized protein n=1 Tax=metagenome TaxID=256318 RepID=A0A2P2C5X3_9ZZZZ
MRNRSVRLCLAAGVAGLGALALIPSGSVVAAPPGNNGTIKLDGIPFDSHQDNEPHVGCLFELDFYNYEQGNYNATVKFIVQPPTGKDIVLQNRTVFIGGDPAGGGGDLDGSLLTDLSPQLVAFMAHPQQGYHVKVAVNAPRSIGADKKAKTFWVTDCGAPYFP